ncbi:MAG: hypothetical protein IAG10_11565 [Planctomycetaceae bacterium]|nr:hypothetical protein [Planctomycetaceae bacterium]
MLRNFCKFGRTHRKHSPARVAEIQSLEPRTLPAGTVNIVVTTNGDVTVTGDNNDVAVDVTANQVSVTGNERTKVKFNGQVFRAGETVVIDEFDDATLLGSLNVDMKDGDDNIKVALDSVMLEIARNLTVNLGDGDDSLRVESLGETKLTVNGDVKLLGGDGADAIIVLGSITSPEIVLNKTLTVDLGAGVDLFGLGRDHALSEGLGFPDDSEFPDADPVFFDFGIFTGDGIGNFTVKGDVKILGGEGVDAIGLSNGGNVMFQKNLEITTGADADFLEWQLGSEVSVTVLGDAKIETQDDSDLIFLKFGGSQTFGQSVHFAKSLTVNTGTGEDLVSIKLADLTVNGEAKINTGVGYDGILVQNFGQASFRKSLDINAGTGHALVNLQSSGPESSLFVAGDLKITTEALSDYVFVGDVLVEIDGELKIDTGIGSDFVGIEFGSNESFLEEGLVSYVGKDLKIDTGNGSDEVSIDVLSETRLKAKLDIKTGTQSDFVSLDAEADLTIDKDVNIDSGNHSDKVVFRAGEGNVLIEGTLNITLGNEDDGLLLGDKGGFAEGFSVLGDIKVAAGAGDDVISVESVTTEPRPHRRWR